MQAHFRKWEICHQRRREVVVLGKCGSPHNENHNPIIWTGPQNTWVL